MSRNKVKIRFRPWRMLIKREESMLNKFFEKIKEAC